MNTSPTVLTLREMRRRGYQLVEVVEHADRWGKHDLFGFGDVICLAKDKTVLVQTTSYNNVSSRMRKIAESPNIAAVREAGWEVWVHGWAQPKGPGTGYVLKREVDLS